MERRQRTPTKAKAVYQRECIGKGAVAKAVEEQEDDVVGSRVIEVLVFLSSAFA